MASNTMTALPRSQRCTPHGRNVGDGCPTLAVAYAALAGRAACDSPALSSGTHSTLTRSTPREHKSLASQGVFASAIEPCIADPNIMSGVQLRGFSSRAAGHKHIGTLTSSGCPLHECTAAAVGVTPAQGHAQLTLVVHALRCSPAGFRPR